MNLSKSRDVEEFRSGLLEWAEDNLRELPWRGPETTPYEVLLAEIFLKQTRTSTVAEILPEVLDKYPDPDTLREADLEELVHLIRPLGLYNHRSRALIEIGEMLGDSSIPESEEELMELPQVGRYVANATLCFGFGQPRPIVDSNVRRVYSRLFSDFDEEALSEDQVWEFAESVLPVHMAERYNTALLDFGAEVCKDSSPRCEECFASANCEYYSRQRKLVD